MPSSACSRPHPTPPSFPTRRSSDLQILLRSRHQVQPELMQGIRVHVDPVLRAQKKFEQVPSDGEVADRLGEQMASQVLAEFLKGPQRSEEHTSELQSHHDLVCRLLLAPAPTPLHPLSLHDALPISRFSCDRVTRCSPNSCRASASMSIPCCVRRRNSNRSRPMAKSPTASASRWPLRCSPNSSRARRDRKSTRLNSSHITISYAVFCLLPPPPHSTLFPYTTLFRSPDSPAIASPGAARTHAGHPRPCRSRAACAEEIRTGPVRWRSRRPPRRADGLSGARRIPQGPAEIGRAHV